MADDNPIVLLLNMRPHALASVPLPQAEARRVSTSAIPFTIFCLVAATRETSCQLMASKQRTRLTLRRAEDIGVE